VSRQPKTGNRKPATGNRQPKTENRQPETLPRCPWPTNIPIMVDYHDNEWGVPVHDDRKHFEFMVLDLFQAGLSWLTVLKKRENFRNAFDNFDVQKIIRYDDKKINDLLQDQGIIRNRLKINAVITNAREFIKIQDEFGSFDQYIWQFTDGKPLVNKWEQLSDLPVSTKESDDMSKELKKRGFKFVGTTICYAYMQAAGLVNDHLTYCYRYQQLL